MWERKHVDPLLNLVKKINKIIAYLYPNCEWRSASLIDRDDQAKSEYNYK